MNRMVRKSGIGIALLALLLVLVPMAAVVCASYYHQSHCEDLHGSGSPGDKSLDQQETEREGDLQNYYVSDLWSDYDAHTSFSGHLQTIHGWTQPMTYTMAVYNSNQHIVIAAADCQAIQDKFDDGVMYHTQGEFFYGQGIQSGDYNSYYWDYCFNSWSAAWTAFCTGFIDVVNDFDSSKGTANMSLDTVHSQLNAAKTQCNCTHTIDY